MAEFDILGARKSGVSDTEIADTLAPKLNYDIEGARKAGVPDTEIANALALKFNSGASAQSSARHVNPLVNYTPIPASEAALSLGTGMVGSAAGGIAGLAASMLPGEPGVGKAVTEGVTNALTYQPRTPGGQGITNAVAFPFEMLAKGADVIGSGVTKGLASVDVIPAPVAATAGTAVNTFLQSLPMLITGGAGKMAPIKGDIKPEAIAAHKAGYTLTPEEMGAGTIAKSAATLAGEPKLARSISRKNEDIHMKYIASDLGLKPDTVVTPEVTQGIIREAGKSFEKAREMGRVQMDGEFFSDIAALYKDHATAEVDFPGGKSPVMDLADRLRQKDADANSIVSMINNLRKDASKAYANRDAELGVANKDAAKSLEALLIRHAEKEGLPADTVQNMRASRERIAKAYAAEEAITGDRINAQYYARLRDNKKPLSGGSQTVGETALQFPRSNMRPSNVPSSSGGPTIADAIMALAGGKGFGLDLLTLLARPATRTILESRPAQAAMINTPAILDAIRRGQAQPLTGMTETAAEQRQ